VEHAVRSYKDARPVQANIIVFPASIIVTIFILTVTLIPNYAINALDFIQAVQHARTLTNAYLA
jgi:hypothetical protein